MKKNLKRKKIYIYKKLEQNEAPNLKTMQKTLNKIIKNEEYLPLKQLFKTHQPSTVLSSIMISLLFGIKSLKESIKSDECR